MDDPLVVALIITGIGMLMLFIALALLYGMMHLMTAVFKDRPEAKSEAQRSHRAQEPMAGIRKQQAESRKRRAAVIAVALARAEQELDSFGAQETDEGASAWRAFHRHRQLTLSPRTRRIR